MLKKLHFLEKNIKPWVSGYTGSNCACGYGVSNYKEGDNIIIKYHFTKTGSLIITSIKTEVINK